MSVFATEVLRATPAGGSLGKHFFPLWTLVYLLSISSASLQIGDHSLQNLFMAQLHHPHSELYCNKAPPGIKRGTTQLCYRVQVNPSARPCDRTERRGICRITREISPVPAPSPLPLTLPLSGGGEEGRRRGRGEEEGGRKGDRVDTELNGPS